MKRDALSEGGLAAHRTGNPSAFHGNFKKGFYAVLGTAGLLYSFLITRFRTGIFNDDAVYVVVARDLLNHSASRFLPIIQPDYPLPGLPLVLAPWTKIAAPQWTHLEWVSILVTLMTLWLLGIWSTRWLRQGEALTLVALYAFNPTVVKFSGIVMPAAYYSLAVIASFLLLARVLEKPSAVRCLALGLMLGWASVVRAEGAVLLISVTAALGLEKKIDQGRILAWVALPLVLWISIAVYWFHFRRLSHSDFASDLNALADYWPRHVLSAIQFAGEFLRLLYLKTMTALDLSSGGWVSGLTVLFIVFCVIGTVVGFYGFWKQSNARHAELINLVIFSGSYFLVHTLWHIALPRYCIVLLPIIGMFLIRGVRQIPLPTGRLSLGTAILMGLFISYAYSNGLAVTESIESPNPMSAPPWRTLAWVKRNTSSTTTLMSPLASSVFLYTSRKSVPIILTGDPETFRYALIQEGIEYIVDRPLVFVTPGIGKTENLNDDWQKMRRWARVYPQWFLRVFQDPQEHTAVYKIQQEQPFIKAFPQYMSAYQDVRAGLPDESLLKLQACLKEYPGLGVGHNLMGTIYFSLAQDADAERAFREAARLLPDSAIPLLNLASLYHRQGESARARDTLNHALEVIAANGNSKKRLVSIQKLLWSWQHKSEIMFF